jgi:hypothetical protein
MIRGMVANLAVKQAADPSNLDGWRFAGLSTSWAAFSECLELLVNHLRRDTLRGHF